MSPYTTLGLKSTATKAEVKKAYRRLTQQLHPDKNPSKAAAAKFLLVKEAYEFLTTGKSSTGAFDKKKAAPDPPPKDDFVDPFPAYDPVFSEVFSGGSVYLDVPLDVAIFGGSAPIVGTEFEIRLNPKQARHGARQPVMAYARNGRKGKFEVTYRLFDPNGFYTLVDGAEGNLRCTVKLSYLEAVCREEVTITSPWRTPIIIKPQVSGAVDGRLRPWCSPIRGHGAPDRLGRPGSITVNFELVDRPIEKESIVTLQRLRDKVDELIKSYDYFK